MHSTATGPAQPLTDAVAELLDTDLTPLSDGEVADLLREIERCTRKLAAASTKVIVETVERSLPEAAGYRNPQKYLIDVLRLSAPDAAARIRATRRVGTWHHTTGEPIAPKHPHTATAQADGDISTDHANTIGKVMHKIPSGVPLPDCDAAEQILAQCARTGTPEDVQRVGDRILGYLDPDGKITDDTDRKRRRGIVIGRQGADGMSTISGELDPTARALLDPLLAKWARPGMNNPDDPTSPSGAEAADTDRVDAATRDTRNAAQRNHDALAEICRSVLASGDAGSHRGLPVTTVLVMGIDQLEKAAGVATTATGGNVPIKDALKLAEQSRPYLGVFDHNGLPLYLYRTERLGNIFQRIMRIVVDRGCTRPNCDAPPSLCALHHVEDYAKGGETNVDVLTLVCDPCHALVNDSPTGWATTIADFDSGFPGRTQWIPPKHIDPEQKPLINHRHHPDEMIDKAVRENDERVDAERKAWRKARGIELDEDPPGLFTRVGRRGVS